MEINGKIKKIGNTQSIGSNGFQKRELILVTDEQYSQILSIEFIQDQCNLLNNFSIDDEVQVSINLRGREWVSAHGEIKYFNTFQGWKITDKNESKKPPPLPNLISVEKDLPF